jgi:hypothetical protein
LLGSQGQPGPTGQVFAHGPRGDQGESGPEGKTGRPGIPGLPGDDAPLLLITPGQRGIKGYPGDMGYEYMFASNRIILFLLVFLVILVNLVSRLKNVSMNYFINIVI